MKRGPPAIPGLDLDLRLVVFPGARLVRLGLAVVNLAVLVLAATGLLPSGAALAGLGVALGVLLSGIVLLVSLVLAEVLPRMLEPVHEKVLEQDLDFVLVLFMDRRLTLHVVDQQVVGVVQDGKVLQEKKNERAQ